MALLFMEGFETYASSTDYRYYRANRGTASLTTNYESGGKYGQGSQEYKFSESSDTIYIGFQLKYYNNVPATPGAGDTIFSFLLGEEYKIHCRIVYETTEVTIERATGASTGTALNTAFLLPRREWHYLIVKIKLHDTTGTLEVWLNGSKIINLSSLDTLNGTTASVNRLAFRTSSAFMVDNIYVGDTSGSDMTDQIGRVYIEGLGPPNADGSTTDFTPAQSADANWEGVVNDSGKYSTRSITYGPSYNIASTSGDKDLYDYGNITGTVTSIYGIQSQFRVYREHINYSTEKGDFLERTVKRILKSGTTETSTTKFNVYRYYNLGYTEITEKDPDTTNAWTESGVNSVQTGIEVVD